jgi:Flp pilus assembly protein TadD
LVLLRKGLPGEAVEALGPALGANPGNPTLRYRLADALVQTGDRDRALRLLMELGEGPFPEREQAAGLLARLREGADPRP